MVPRRTLALLAAATLVFAALLPLTPAQAASGITLSRSDQNAAVLIIDARAMATRTFLGFDTQQNTVTLRTGGDFDSWPADCVQQVLPVLGQYVNCPAASVAGLIVVFGPGNDEFTFDGGCVPELYVDGGDGSNTVGGASCNTVLTYVGGPGSDSVAIPGGGGEATLGAGDDSVRAGGGAVVVHGGDGNDSLSGSAGADQIYGDAGNDTLVGHDGNDLLDGGAGDDRFGVDDLGAGADSMVGGEGNDSLDYTAHAKGVSVSLDGQANDGSSGEGDNVGSDLESITGSNGNDVLTGDAAANSFDGSSGDDTIDGAMGTDTLSGGFGNDTITGGADNDRVYGGAGDDTLNPGTGADSVYGDSDKCDSWSCLSGADKITTTDAQIDTINCGPGPDVLSADAIDVWSQDGYAQCESVTTSGPPPAAALPTPTATTVVTASATPTPSGAGQTPLPPTATIPATAKASSGIAVGVACASACSVTGVVSVPQKVATRVGLKSRVVGTTSRSLSGPATVTFRLAAKALKRLKRLGRVSVTLRLTTTVAGKAYVTTTKVRLRL